MNGFWCRFGIHKWTNWEIFKITKDADFGTPIIRQVKYCIYCNKIKTRVET